MKIKNILIVIAGCTIAALLVYGASWLNQYVNDKAREQAEEIVKSQPEYQKYEEYVTDKKLDEEGKYILGEIANHTSGSDEVTKGKILVTFATNSFLRCVYNINEKETLPDMTPECYLNPGDSLYATGVTNTNKLTNLYEFAEYRVWSYDSNGNRSDEPMRIASPTGLVLTVPSDYKGGGFSVEPIGKYSKRTITVQSFYYESADVLEPLYGGEWTKDDEVIKGQETSISPIESYTIKYNYKEYGDDFYFVDSSPECFYASKTGYYVIFQNASALDTTTEYTVRMHPFIKVTITDKTQTSLKDLIPKINPFNPSPNNAITDITISGESIPADNYSDSVVSIPKVRVGDQIVIKVRDEYKITGKGINISSPINLPSGGYRYLITVPETNDPVELTLSERNPKGGTYTPPPIDNADIVLIKEDGSAVAVGDELPADSEKITVEITPHAGYYIAGKDVDNYSKYSKTMKYSDFDKDLEKILENHPILPYINITIDCPDKRGTCIYKLDGKEINGQKIVAREGQKIELTITPYSNYTIEYGNVISEKWHKLWRTNSITDSITVDNNMNNTTISSESFEDIHLKEVGKNE